MKRLFIQLIFIIVSSAMLFACDNSQQAKKDNDTTIAAPQDNDCLDDSNSDSHRLDNVAAQGCPVK